MIWKWCCGCYQHDHVSVNLQGSTGPSFCNSRFGNSFCARTPKPPLMVCTCKDYLHVSYMYQLYFLLECFVTTNRIVCKSTSICRRSSNYLFHPLSLLHNLCFTNWGFGINSGPGIDLELAGDQQFMELYTFKHLYILCCSLLNSSTSVMVNCIVITTLITTFSLSLQHSQSIPLIQCIHGNKQIHLAILHLLT